MKCPSCREDYDAAVCPHCLRPVKMRSGMIIPAEDTLIETGYGMGKLYARYYRVAVLRPHGDKPMKLCFGCDEKPLGFATEKKSWFNPVIIDPTNMPKLDEINKYQLASQAAYECFIKGKKTTSEELYRLLYNLRLSLDSKSLSNLAIRFLKIMEI